MRSVLLKLSSLQSVSMAGNKSLLKYFLLILYCILLSSCQDTDSPEGIWFASHISEGAKTSLHTEPFLLEFSNGVVRDINLRRDNPDLILFEQPEEYTLEGNRITLKDEEELWYSFDGDSMVMHIRDWNRALLLQRLPDSLKSSKLSTDLLQKTFYSSGFSKDTLHFINDSLLLYTSRSHLGNPIKKWYITEHGGFRFFVIEEIAKTTPLLQDSDTHGFSLLYPAYDSKVLPFRQIEKSVSKNSLAGVWVEFTGTDDPIPPPLYSPFIIQFTTNELIIKKGTYSKQLDWELTGDGKYIYLPERLPGFDASWQISQHDGGVLQLNMGHFSEVRKFHLNPEYALEIYFEH